MADVVFATAGTGKAYVFRHNFSGNKWENMSPTGGTSIVSFRKRSERFFIRIQVEGGKKVRRREEGKEARKRGGRAAGDRLASVVSGLPSRESAYIGRRVSHTHTSRSRSHCRRSTSCPEKLRSATLGTGSFRCPCRRRSS